MLTEHGRRIAEVMGPLHLFRCATFVDDVPDDALDGEGPDGQLPPRPRLPDGPPQGPVPVQPVAGGDVVVDVPLDVACRPADPDAVPGTYFVGYTPSGPDREPRQVTQAMALGPGDSFMVDGGDLVKAILTNAFS